MTSTRLRRTVVAVLLGGPFGLLPGLITLLFFPLAVREPVFVVPCLVAVGFTVSPLLRSAALCDGALVVRTRGTGRLRRIGFDELHSVEVRPVRSGGGYGYRGAAVVLVLRDGHVRVFGHSRYCGRRRLEEWAVAFESHAQFDGDVVRSDREREVNPPRYFPGVGE